MAKLVKKKKKLKIDGLLSLLFVFSLFAYLGSTTLLKSYNLYTNRKLYAIETENNEMQNDIHTLQLELAKYTDSNYLMSVFEKNGVDATYSLDRIVDINNEEQ